MAELVEGGDGRGGTSGNSVEGRIASLEAHMEHVREDVSTLKADVGTVKVDVGALKALVAKLPTHLSIAGIVMGGMTLFAAIIVFADQIRHLVGLK